VVNRAVITYSLLHKAVLMRPTGIFRLLRRYLARGTPVFKFVLEGKGHGHRCNDRALHPPTGHLEAHPQRKLNCARVIHLGERDRSERAGGDSSLRPREIHRIRGVKKLGVEAHIVPLVEDHLFLE